METVRRVLAPQIRRLTIEKVIVNRPEVIAWPEADAFCKRLEGQVLAEMERRGKFLILTLLGGGRIVLHLRMTGCLLLTPSDQPEEKHTHVVFRLSGEKKLLFSDARRFGRFWLLQKGEADVYSGMDRLGIELFAPDLTGDYLAERWGGRKKAVKECLLDQRAVAGIGNIYADEILFAAGLYPACPANRLTPEDWKRLAAVIPERLSYFIEKNGLTPEEYLETRGRAYRNTPFLRVYGRAGEPCPVCGEILCRRVIGGRSSTYCPDCQKEK